MPGDFSSTSRFVRAYILSKLMLEQKSNREILYHATSIIANVFTSLRKIYDSLDNCKRSKKLTIAYKDNAAYQGTGSIGVYVL